MRRVAKLIVIGCIAGTLVGCRPREFSVDDEKVQYTNIELSEWGNPEKIILDTEESRAFANILEAGKFKRKGGKRKNKGLYLINVLKGNREVKTFQIIDEHHIVYLDKLYKSKEAINLNEIKEILEKEKATKEENLKEKRFKATKWNRAVSIYISHEGEKDREKIDHIMTQTNEQTTKYQDIEGYFEQFQWIDYEKKVVVTYEGPEGRNFILLDMENSKMLYNSELDVEGLKKALENSHETLVFEMDEEGGIDFSYEDISNDSSKIMIRYAGTDIEGHVQGGTLWYELQTGKISGMIQDY